MPLPICVTVDVYLNGSGLTAAAKEVLDLLEPPPGYHFVVTQARVVSEASMKRGAAKDPGLAEVFQLLGWKY